MIPVSPNAVTPCAVEEMEAEPCKSRALWELHQKALKEVLNLPDIQDAAKVQNAKALYLSGTYDNPAYLDRLADRLQSLP